MAGKPGFVKLMALLKQRPRGAVLFLRAALLACERARRSFPLIDQKVEFEINQRAEARKPLD